jgi:heme exporter protein D
MMPDLGKYAFSVLSAYGVSIALILGLVGATLYRARQVRTTLRQIEARQQDKRNG